VDDIAGLMLATDQHEALKLLANAAHGCTVPFLLESGCSVTALRHLARRRLAIADRVRVPGEPKSPTVVRLRISKAGRQALQDSQPNRRKNLGALTVLALFAIGVIAGMCVAAFMISHA
jgi:hypothetical protein